MLKTKLILNNNTTLIKANEMRPMQIGIIRSSHSSYDGDLVMRTQSTKNHEIMNLSRTSTDNGWTATKRENLPTFLVELISKNDTVTLTQE